MTQLFISIAALLSVSVSMANSTLPAGGAYYAGQQPVGIAGEVKDCFVEAVFSPQGSRVEVRALIADPHDGALIGKGTVRAKYTSSKDGYYFSSTKKNAPIQEMLLNAKVKKTAEGMNLTFLDGGHYDSVSCNNLTAAKDSQLLEVQEMFEHFADFVEEEEDGHDDHDHQH